MQSNNSEFKQRKQFTIVLFITSVCLANALFHPELPKRIQCYLLLVTLKAAFGHYRYFHHKNILLCFSSYPVLTYRSFSLRSLRSYIYAYVLIFLQQTAMYVGFVHSWPQIPSLSCNKVTWLFLCNHFLMSS